MVFTYALAKALRMKKLNKVPPRHSTKAQQALDFMVSYGIALLIIAIALYVVLQLGAAGLAAAPSSCTPTPPFLCPAYVVNTSGTMLIRIVQASGSTITVTGMACSTAINSTNGRPAYGNVHVLSPSVAPSYYPTTTFNGGITIYSGSAGLLSANCYGPSGKASAGLGSTFFGYVWINYTSSAMPQTHTVSMIAQITARYTSLSAVPTVSTTTTVSTTLSTISSTVSTTLSTTVSTTVSTTLSTTISTTISTVSTISTIAYLAVTLTNSQSSATPTDFQQMIVVNSSKYSAYISSTWSNVEFTTSPNGAGTPLDAWIETNASNTAKYTIVWVNLGSSTVGANSNFVIYMNFMPTPVLSSLGPTGEAPQLSSTYGQYDDGGKVFITYGNFAGTTVSSNYTQVTGGTGAISQNNGITLGVSGGSSYAAIISNTGVSPSQTITEGDIFTWGNGETGGIGLMTSVSASAPMYYFGIALAQGYAGSGWASGGLTSIAKDYIYCLGENGLAWLSTSSQEWYGCYSPYTTSASYLSIPSTVYPTIGMWNYTGYTSSIEFEWLRTRYYPPNGVMPSVSFSSVE
jgi:hypothetical protein